MAITQGYWDATTPLAGMLIPDTPAQFRQITSNQVALWGNEHRVFPTTAGGGGNVGMYNLQGTARAYFLATASAPTTKANAEALESEDQGLLWWDTTLSQLKVLTVFDGITWATIPGLAAATNAFTGNITIGGTLAVTGTLDVTGNLDPTTFETTNGGFLDEDDLTSDSDVAVASQQSVKAYVDGRTTFTPATYAGEESVTFPNGLTIKMGEVAVGLNAQVEVTYGVAFANGVISAQVSRQIQTDSEQPVHCVAKSGAETTTLQIKNTGSADTVYWMVIGY